MKNIISTLSLIAIIFLLGSCTSTQILSSWVAPNTPQAGFKKVLVLGVMDQRNLQLRENLESDVVAQLTKSGYSAVSAYKQYGPKAFANENEDAVAANLKQSGFDAVITVALLDKTKDQYYQPGRVSYTPIGIQRFGRYYTTIYDRVYQPGYYTTATNYFLEANMYNTQSGDLVYSSQTQASDPASSQSLSRDFSNTLVKNLMSKKVI